MSGDCLLGLSAYDSVNERAVLEDEKGRNAAYVELCGCAWVFVNVQFGYQIVPLGFCGQLV